MKSKISIIGGCGHVGLPLGMTLASHDYPTYLYDIDISKIDQINKGTMPHLEEKGSEILEKVLQSGHLEAGSDLEKLREQDVLIFTTGTPIDEYLNPKINDLLKVLEQVIPYVKDGQLFIFRSTLFPGTTQLIHRYLQSKNIQIHLAFCPERIIQGKGLTEIKKLPQLISGLDQEAIQLSSEIFRTITEKEPIQLETMEAELAKLFCNAHRYINFAVSNQFYEIAEKAGADFRKIYYAMTHDYPRMSSFAKPGLTAGPCLLKDTMQLASFSQNTFFLGHSAMLINEGMPAFMMEMMKNRFAMTSLSDVKISILGMAFKSDNDDIRDSLAFKLKKSLEVQGVRVFCHDPFLDPTKYPNLPLVELDVALKSEIIIIGSPHSVYKEMEFSKELKMIDIWGIT